MMMGRWRRSEKCRDVINVAILAKVENLFQAVLFKLCDGHCVYSIQGVVLGPRNLRDFRSSEI